MEVIGVFKKIDNILLFVKDLKTSLVFYKDKLGLSVKTKEEGYIEFELSGVILGLVEKEEAANMISKDVVMGSHGTARPFSLAVTVEDVDKTYEVLVGHGIRFVKKPFTQSWGQRTAYFEDPDGNIWEIHA
ncbi:TPA: glyoxalase [Patescibacteria group bacterium]|nr:glyoxalase [Patescibacteria group bacterium]